MKLATVIFFIEHKLYQIWIKMGHMANPLQDWKPIAIFDKCSQKIMTIVWSFFSLEVIAKTLNVP